MLIPTSIYPHYFSPYKYGDLGAVRDRLTGNPKEMLNHDECGHNPMHYAVFYGQLQIVQELYNAGYEFNAQDKKNYFERTSLTYAVLGGKCSVIEFILDRIHSRLNLDDKYGNHPAMYTAIQNKDKKITWRLIVPFMRSLNRLTNKNSINLLHIFVKTNNLEMLQLLLEYPSAKTLINAATLHGFNLISIALIAKSYSCLEYLIANFPTINFAQKDCTQTDMFAYLDTTSASIMNKYNVNIFQNSNVLKYHTSNLEILNILQLSNYCTESHIKEMQCLQIIST